MAYKRTLITVDYHYDSDTGIYGIGELDFGISGELQEYCKTYLDGRRAVVDMLRWIADQVEQEKYG